MRVAIVHYHLRVGGVARVIHHSVQALQERSIDAVVLSGAAPDCEWSCPVGVVEGLDYISHKNVTDRAARLLADRMKRAAVKALGRSPDVWHIHNHALGKNPALTMAVHHLAAEGQHILLQMHDFAEDGRPALYHRMLNDVAKGDIGIFSALTYPQAPQVHYATLNQRDSCFLRLAGANPAFIHWLPNPVILPADDHSLTAVKWEGKRRFLYPTRALRRKNIGEVLLWAVMEKANDSFALTLAPTNQTDRVAYEAWKRYARRWRLPIRFEVGLTSKVSLGSWMRASTAIITTSVAEGFGLAFLEPWLAGRPVMGRDLPEITREFRDTGVQWPRLYNRLEIPLSWIGADNFRRALCRGLKQSRRAYGRPLTSDECDCAYDTAVRKKSMDFGRLNEPLQLAVIDRIRSSTRLRHRIRPMNLGSGSKDSDVAYNAKAIRKAYGLEQYGTRLMAVYTQLLQSRPGPLSCLSADRLLDQFLASDRFCLLRT
ncbi:MAG: hypothetical protein Q7J98_00295 [Kiritimatiellia bacterium]|nr:hypothetical protein [Kiritimatiellia bacterium]